MYFFSPIFLSLFCMFFLFFIIVTFSPLNVYSYVFLSIYLSLLYMFFLSCMSLLCMFSLPHVYHMYVFAFICLLIFSLSCLSLMCTFSLKVSPCFQGFVSASRQRRGTWSKTLGSKMALRIAPCLGQVSGTNFLYKVFIRE